MDDNIDEIAYANGIDATTGEYLLPPMTATEMSAAARGAAVDHNLIAALTKVADAANPDKMGLRWNIDPLDLSQTGWAIVFSADEDPAVKAALEPLVAWRRAQVDDPERMKVLTYKAGESRQRWLSRHGIAVGSIKPTAVPFYLLLIGCPERIPFTFCRELAVEYAVGMLSFDAPADYATYAAGVLAVERRETPPRPRRVSFFATRHAFDAATQLSADKLVKPLCEGELARELRCQFDLAWGERATRDALTEILTRKDGSAPALLFTASHGMGFPPGHPDQLAHQGALLCQDWAGPGVGPVRREQYFSAADVPDSANVAGLFAFVFACFGGGTPARDRFEHRPGVQPPVLADAPFAAALPRRLLAHPRGGALGCIAHVDRAWSHSIVQAGAGAQLMPFENALGYLLFRGWPIGWALKDFNDRYATLSVSLANTLEKIKSERLSVSEVKLASEWVQRNDAEGYALFGDPAARMNLESAG